MSKSGRHGGHSQSRNDQRSNSLNFNNSSHQASNDNRSSQLNPNNPTRVESQQNKSH